MVFETCCVWAHWGFFFSQTHLDFFCWISVVHTSGFRGWMTISVELCPIPWGIPAVRYMAPTERFFLASLAAFIRSTVTPSSAKLCTPGLAKTPSSHSLKRWLWVTAERKEENKERGDTGSEMLYSLESMSTSVKYHRALARQWDHFHDGACMYFCNYFLLPVLKLIILKELSICIYCCKNLFSIHQCWNHNTGLSCQEVGQHPAIGRQTEGNKLL